MVLLASTRQRRSGRGERPTFELERALWQAGNRWVAGVDEVGRGALAGPVVAAACIFEPSTELPDQLRDSKRLTDPQRRALADWVRQYSLRWAIGAASHREVDRLGIVRATALAMLRALQRLGPVDHVLYDGLPLTEFERLPGTAVVHGDMRCASIAAASILAKVIRDDLMARLAVRYPGYGWEENAGYGTPSHRRAIRELGSTPFHRRSFQVRMDTDEE